MHFFFNLEMIEFFFMFVFTKLMFAKIDRAYNALRALIQNVKAFSFTISF